MQLVPPKTTGLRSTLIAVGIFIALFVLLTMIGATLGLGPLGQYELLSIALISLVGAYLAYRRLVRSTNAG